MSIVTEERPSSVAQRTEVTNNFSIKVATVNGSGSQTSNGVLLRTLFSMGIAVNGKNLFPSNIHGLPTWFTIRLSKDGYLAYRDEYEIVICMNGVTVAEDMANVAEGGIVLYDDSLPIPAHRKDVTYYPMPVRELVKAADLPFSLRGYISNMVYVGVLAQLLDIDLAEIERALVWNFEGKPKPVALNMEMVRSAHAWAEKNLTKTDPYRVADMGGQNPQQILIDGNTAAALGAIFGGVTVVSWYPITPSSSMADALTKYLPELRAAPNECDATFAIIQAEDELAAIGMVIGAGWAGARAMTATSGPGLDLMAEFAGLAYFAEIPAVIWDVQRMGPSTGLPTRTSQGDIQDAYHLSHGDTEHVVLFPSDPKECFEFGGLAFDLAERLQTLVLVLSDLDLGMNVWISDKFEYPDKPLDRGKVLTLDDLERLGGAWGRYKDIDGDGICYRTLPGTPDHRAAYFTRGTGHNEAAVYSERPDDWEQNMDRLARKFETARTLVPAPAIDRRVGARIGIVSLGTNDPAIQEARDLLRASGIESNYMRLRALPINQAVRDFLNDHDRVFVVENNYQGQLHKILLAEEPSCGQDMLSVKKSSGFPLTAQWIHDEIAREEHIK